MKYIVKSMQSKDIENSEYFSSVALSLLSNPSDKEILEDMVILGIVNRVLSGQEYAGVQKNYLHYLAGTNPDRQDYLNTRMLKEEDAESMDVGDSVKILVVYANLYDDGE